MSEQAGPPSKQVQAAKQVQELVKDGDDALIVGIFSSEQDAAFEIYMEACEYRETVRCVCVEHCLSPTVRGFSLSTWRR